MSKMLDDINHLRQVDQENRERKNRYLELLEKCKPEDVAQRTHLYATAALDLYVVQTRIQAQESFNVAKRICIAGFILISIGVIVGILGPIINFEHSDIAGIIATSGGVVAEIVAATVFVLYGKTISQFNAIVEKISESQKYSFDTIKHQKEDVSTENPKQQKVERIS